MKRRLQTDSKADFFLVFFLISLLASLVINYVLYVQVLQLQEEVEQYEKTLSFLRNPIVLNNTFHSFFIPRIWMETPVFEGNATGFLYSPWPTIENGRIIPQDGIMAFLWGNYSYRLFDMASGDVYFTARDALRNKGIILDSYTPFYLVNLEGARPMPYNIWSKDDIEVTSIRIVEGSQKYPFISGELASSIIYAWNVIESQYTLQIASITQKLSALYNTIRVFIRPFWSVSNETVRIVVQKIDYYEGYAAIYVPPIYLLTTCFVFDRYGEFVETYIVPPFAIADF